MNNSTLDAILDNFLETESISPEEREYCEKALQYVDKDRYDDAEDAINHYAAVCKSKAFKQGFAAACILFQEIKQIR